MVVEVDNQFLRILVQVALELLALDQDFQEYKDPHNKVFQVALRALLVIHSMVPEVEVEPEVQEVTE